MSANTSTVERRLGRVQAILVAIHCIAAKENEGIAGGTFCEDLELMAQEGLGKVMAVLGTEVLNRDC